MNPRVLPGQTIYIGWRKTDICEETAKLEEPSAADRSAQLHKELNHGANFFKAAGMHGNEIVNDMVT